MVSEPQIEAYNGAVGLLHFTCNWTPSISDVIHESAHIYFEHIFYFLVSMAV